MEEQNDDLPEVTEESVGQLTEQQRKDYAAKLKAAGNKAYGSKDYNRAIDLYGQAILCKADAVFYSNRAACWNAMSNWSKVIDDTTAAISIDPEYIKALNRRANAYEQEGRFSEALLDYTASCIIDQFRNDASAQAVERLLKKAYGSKDYNRAIDLYGQAILCKADAVFYSNRAACWNAMSNWSKVIDDTTAAISIDPEYIKALNRRANAYEQEGRFSEALLDYTASCIIDQFRNDASAQAVERLLKKVAESKAKAIMEGKDKKLPSPTFVSNYLQSFRDNGLPEGLEETADLPEGSGKALLRKGLKAIKLRTGEGYTEAAESFEKAIEAGDLEKNEALAYNMRGTFRYLRGDSDSALADLNKSLELDPGLVQSYVKRASMHLEQSKSCSQSSSHEFLLTSNFSQA